jgi:hypothetical protein
MTSPSKTAAVRRRKIMQTLGWVTAITAAVAVVAVGVLVVMGLPDIRRYMRIRRM